MQLRPEQLGQALSCLRGPASSGGGVEQRRHTRMRVRGRVKVAAMADNHTARGYTAVTSDVSAGGVALMQAFEVSRGARLLVCLPRAGQLPVSIICLVSRCQPLADGLYCVGARFVQLAGRKSESSGDRTHLAG